MDTWKASARLGAILFLMTAAARGQASCSEPIGDIEQLPFTHKGEVSCSAASSLGRYQSPTCRNGFDYVGAERVYKVRLNQGNEVSFSLDVQGSADLMLALVQVCGDGKTCVSSSADFIGSDDEEISAAKYSPGVYYLYVDSVEGGCGSYELTVKGTNPTPDLKLNLSAPERVIAGNLMTYDLSLTNEGTLDATGAQITHTLPEGLTWQPGSDCPSNGSTVVCSIGNLKTKEAVSKEIVVKVSPDARGSLTSVAEATANEGSPVLPARDKATTRVTTESDLSIRMSSSANPVVAGQPLTYSFTLHNAGPSDATQVTVTDTLSGKERFPRASTAWPCETATIDGITTVKCKVSRILVGETVTHSITVDVEPSALEPLVNRATVTADETEPACKRKPECGPNSDFIETGVERKTDLTIALSQEPVGEIALGNDFFYVLTVRNNGPSDSSGAAVVLRDEKGHVVPRRIGYLPSGKEETVKIQETTEPDGLPGKISATASVTSQETDPVGGNNETKEPLETTLKIQADLRIESDVNLTEVCAGGILKYTIATVNGGPSNYRGGEISGKLSKGLSFVSSPDGCEAGDDARTVKCTVPPLEFGKKHPVRIAALVAHTETEVWVPGMGDKVTTVLPDLLVSLSAKDLVSPNELFDYTVTVKNLGPSEAKDVKVELKLPSGTVRFEIGDIPKGASESRTHSATAPSTSGSLTASAFLVNPIPCSNTAEFSTAVTDEDGVALALTMKADAQAVAVGDTLTYTIEVSNQGSGESPKVTLTDELPPNTCLKTTDGCDAAAKVVFSDLQVPDTVTVQVQVLPGAKTPLKNTVSLGPAPAPSASVETPVLPFRLLLPFFEVDGRPEEVTTRLSLRNLGNEKIEYSFLATSGSLEANEMATIDLRDVFLSISGYAAISSDPPDASLAGDFVRVDPTPGTASGGLLVSATEMCREWSVRFEAGTDFLFFAQGSGDDTPVATGRVFTEKGQYVQRLEIPNQGASFRIRTQDLGLLASVGSIEWTFREGFAGHVAAVHREEGKDEVAVPGHCRTGAATQTLILPFFLADPGTTLLTIRNETGGPVQGKASIFSSDGTQAGSQADFKLAGHEMRSLDLRGSGVPEGYLRLDLPPSAEVSGDFRLDSGRARAGGALVRRSQLCRCWNVRYEDGSRLLFYEENSETGAGKVHLLPASEGEGAIERDFGEHAVGYAAALLTGQGEEGDYSVLVPGICRPCP